MKQKKRVKKLEQRQAAYEALPLKEKSAAKRPGSLKKKAKSA